MRNGASRRKGPTSMTDGRKRAFGVEGADVGLGLRPKNIGARVNAATTPVQRPGVLLAHLTQACQPSPEGSPGRPAHRPFRGLLGVHSRCRLHTRAVTNS